MPTGRVGILSASLLIPAGIELILIHRTTIAGASPWLIGDVVVIHVTAVAWLMARNVTLRCRVILAVIGVTGVAAAILGLGLSVRSAGLAAGGVCHAAAYSMLLTRFAMSLRPGREPLVTSFARRIRRTMSDKVVRYTRLVTVGWCVFFATQLTVSVTLFVAAPEVVWSTFVNLWNLPLIVAMMLAEFGCRSFVLRQEPRTSLIATLAGLRHVGGLVSRLP
jgi:uncharacterized membrane protein